MPSAAAARSPLDLGERGVDLGLLLVAGGRERRRGARRRPATCSVERGRASCWASSSRSITSSSSSSSVEIRRSSDASSCCIRSRSLGLVISPWSIRSRSRDAARLDLLDVGVGLRCSTVEVVDDDPRVARLVRPARCGSACSAAISASSGRCPAGGAAGRRAGRGPATSSSFSWAEGSAFSGSPRSCRCGLVWGRWRSRADVQGSVHRVLTRVSTVSPSAVDEPRLAPPAARSTPPPSAPRRPAPGPSFSRNSAAGWWRRSLVT